MTLNRFTIPYRLNIYNFRKFSITTTLYAILFLSLTFTACKSKKNLGSASKPRTEKPSNKIAGKYANEMGVSKKAIKNGVLYNFIDDWEGTKYQYGGLSKRGVDCSGLVYLIYQEVYGKSIPRTTSQQVKIIKRKYESQLREGDLVFFDFDGKKFSHVGVYLQNGYYVHASTRRGVMIEKLRNPYTYKYFSRCGSVK
ncbi:MAG TPA: NlpC/P60 family protein [Pelobium sp.]|nr:NlpC/P60 family protein [Pelobium sp.]